jgi:nucleotide-binding universal stress UspA family protein
MKEQTPTGSEDDEPRIVVGVEGSPCACRALEYAAHQAARTGALLHVVCAYHLPPAEETLIVPLGLIEEVAAAVVRQSLDRVGQIEPAVVTKGEVLFGSPGLVLAEASLGAAELVVGVRGHGHLVDLLLGSVSEYVVREASCTTTVVR